jgi:hypothetical protein
MMVMKIAVQNRIFVTTSRNVQFSSTFNFIYRHKTDFTEKLNGESIRASSLHFLALEKHRVTNAMIRKEAKINGPIEFHGDFL